MGKLQQAMKLATVAVAIQVPEHPDTERRPFSKAAYGSYIIALRQCLHCMQQNQSELVKISDDFATDEQCKRLIQLCPEAAEVLKQVLSMIQILSEHTDRVQQATKDSDALWQRIQLFPI